MKIHHLVMITIASYTLGAISGYLAARWHHKRENQNMNMNATMRAIVGGIVTAMWIVSTSASITIGGYTTPILVHAMMGAIVGYLFGAETAVGGMIGKQTQVSDSNRNESGKGGS